MSDSLRLAVLQMYAEVDREVADAGPVCVSSGKCCRFKEYDHTLFVSSLEADVLLASAPPYDPESVTADFCPFQEGNLCTAREPRPLACRVYYCDPSYVDACHTISEKYLRRLKDLADEHDVGWNYAPLHVFLKDGPPTPPARHALTLVEARTFPPAVASPALN